MGDHTPDANHGAAHAPVDGDASKVVEAAATVGDGGSAWAPRETFVDGRRVLLVRKDEDPTAADR